MMQQTIYSVTSISPSLFVLLQHSEYRETLSARVQQGGQTEGGRERERGWGGYLGDAVILLMKL